MSAISELKLVKLARETAKELNSRLSSYSYEEIVVWTTHRQGADDRHKKLVTASSGERHWY